jgi:hypothetical protein
MSSVQAILLIFGLGTVLRGVYALVTSNVVEDGEDLEGPAAARFGLILVVIGLGTASHALFDWPWVNVVVGWIHAQG